MNDSTKVIAEPQGDNEPTLSEILTSEPVRIEDHRVSASLFDNKFDIDPKPFSGKLSDLIGYEHEVRDEKDGPAFSPATFKDGKTRGGEAAECLSLFAFDADHLSKEEMSKRAKLMIGCARVGYTTFRHQLGGCDDNCGRSILLASRPFTPEEHRVVYPIVGGLIGGYDISASDPARIFFKPAVHPERTAFATIKYVDGYAIDVDKVVALAKSMPKSFVSRSQNHVPRSTKLISESRLADLFKNCETARVLARAGRTRQLGHAEGFALLSWVACFDNGVARFTQKMIGWGKTDRDIYQIDHFVKKGYSPYSCAKAQELGLCTKKHPEACLTARIVNGVKISPSPIRFALRPLDVEGHIAAVLEKYGVGHG